MRTHIEKIINFARVLALLEQRKRLRVKVNNHEYVVAEPQDFLRALNILRTSIIETVSRIEKPQEEVLKLFAPNVSLTKHEVASKLKVSTSTAYRALRTLAQGGYLKEDTSSKTYRYELLQEKPNHLCLLENQRSISLFHRNTLKKWLDTISSSRHQRGNAVEFYDPIDGSWSQHHEAYVNALPNAPALACRDEEMYLTPNVGLDSATEANDLCKPENQRCLSQNPANFKAVYWSDSFYGWRPCAACGQTKLTSWQAETFKGENLWLCEDCKEAWEKQRGEI